MKRLFDPFFTTKPKGIGLGPAVAKKIIEKHNGSIQVKSKPGEGSTFILKLPFKKRKTIMFNKTNINILVVDDEEGMRETLGDALEDKGYNVVLAEDGYKAIQKIKETSFSIIFMDIKMPGIDGIKAFEEIKKVDPEVAVIMMTGYSVEDMIEEALNKGAYTVIYKPFDPAKLIKIVEEIREGK